MLPSYVKGTLLGLHSSFVVKKYIKVWKAGLLYLLWMISKARNRVSYEGEELSIQSLKSSIFCFLWSETKGYIGDISFLLLVL